MSKIVSSSLAAIILGALLFLVPSLHAQTPVAGSGDPHAPFDRLLRKYVKEGRVNYKGFQAEEKALDSYLDYFARTSPRELPPDEKKAFWINAYNAFTIKLILQKYPKISSIKNFWGPWDKADWEINGSKETLNYMEHQVLRKMHDPRIHMAIVCASFSCPDLASEAYTAARLDEQLDAAMRRFFANPQKGFRAATEKGLVYGENQNIYLSKILSWFSEDFGNNQEEILAYVKPFLPEPGRKFLELHAGKLNVKYFSYDWRLNGE